MLYEVITQFDPGNAGEDDVAEYQIDGGRIRLKKLQSLFAAGRRENLVAGRFKNRNNFV